MSLLMNGVTKCCGLYILQKAPLSSLNGRKAILLFHVVAMARGRGAKKSAQKGKNKKTGPSTSPIKKTRYVDELRGIAELEVVSPVLEKCSKEVENPEAATTSSPVIGTNNGTPLREESDLTEWVQKIRNGSQNTKLQGRVSWAARMEEEAQMNAEAHVNIITPSVMVESDYIQAEIEYWSSVVVCYVLGANPPLPVMEGYFKRILGSLGIAKVALFGNGMFIVRFNNVDDCMKVMSGGFQLFDRKPLIIKL
ncbi:uncharacterized protein LOC125499059 [Beta vulgaris subsp. vulgaris]|uniref:uncharacterized protein LOC125499059 n=1 Tax=Beta vulgaris subsp. vulgaris TaxID=3555 RepID=UPI002037099E|nr:uncharacterized protein LOC125499059 [Beta vulgaris subsp. vulgaris]XP_048503435.1 uncharacterized protein LOC125499059 [Beta vulgaris subsp. vulgaris]